MSSMFVHKSYPIANAEHSELNPLENYIRLVVKGSRF
jgi:hypothetical protein